MSLIGSEDRYIVWSPTGATPPRVTHKFRWQAHIAAENMAKLRPGQEFCVMKIKSISRTANDVETVKDSILGQIASATAKAIATATESVIVEPDSFATAIVKALQGQRRMLTTYRGKWRPNLSGAEKA